MNFSLLRKERFIRLNENIYKGKFLQGLESSSYEIELRTEVYMITLVNSCKMPSELAFLLPTRIMHLIILHFNPQPNYISNVSLET